MSGGGLLRSKLLSMSPGAPVQLAVLCALVCISGGAAYAAGQMLGPEPAQEEASQQPPSELGGGADVGPAAPSKSIQSVSPDILTASDLDASQRLRFDVGDRVFFAAGSAKLGARARNILTRQARWLKAWKASAVVAGHGDEGVNGELDERIGLARAEAVRQRLVEEGLSPERVDVVSMGRRDPVADCREPECAVQNRRAVIHVMKTELTDGAR